MIFFSVIIPTYNRRNYIGETLESVLSQDYREFEVIVIDDGSTDDTDRVVLSYTKGKSPKVRYYKKENNERGAARNFGVKKSKGDYVFFLDSDDIMLPNHLAEAAKYLKSNSFPEVYHQRYRVIDGKDKILYHAKPLKGDISKLLLTENILACLIFLRKDIALRIPFDERRELAASEDKLMNLKLAARYTIHYQNIYTIAFREHQNRSSNMVDVRKWIMQHNMIHSELENDTYFSKKFGKQGLKVFDSYSFYFISTKAALGKDRKSAIKYLIKNLRLQPNLFFTLKPLKIIYYLFFKS